MYESAVKKLRTSVVMYAGLRSMKSRQRKAVFVFGVSEASHHIINEFRVFGIRPVGVIDNDERKQSMFCGGVPVIDVDTLMKMADEDSVVFIMSPFWQEMKRQIVIRGIKARQIRVIKSASRIDRTFFARARHALGGKRVYRKLRKKYGDEIKIFLCPYTGTGDIYLIGTFFDAYLSRNHISDYIFVVVSKACKKAAGLFDIRNVVQLNSTGECSSLISYYMVEPDECRIEILNDSWGEIYTNPTQWIRGYRGHNFTDMFRRYVFRLPEDTHPEMPVLKDATLQVEKLFREHGLTRHRTAILSPYASTLSDMPETFWEQLTGILTDMGYAVCTNSSGKKEPAIKGTSAVFFPLNIAPQVVEYAGTFIGVRSGFCDIVSSANAKKIILYDRNNWFFNCSAYEYFSLRGMGLCEDAYEIEFDGRQLEDTLVKIKAVLEERRGDDT